MRKTFMVFVLSAAAVLAFSPPPTDSAKVNLCESSGGIVNITLFDPDAGREIEPGRPRSDFAPKLVFRCDCPQDLVWDEAAGCVKPPTPPSLWERIIAFIRKIFGVLA